MENCRYPFVNTPLPYAYDALEPFIDGQTMRLHHDRHLQTYIDDLNALLAANPSLQRLTLRELIRTAPQLPPAVGTPLRRSAGGVYNHRFYFESMTNPARRWPSGALARAIGQQFGGFQGFWCAFRAAALSVFGSGYAWLVCDGGGQLRVYKTCGQDNPIAAGYRPLLAVDVWEHAYYLKHYNERAAYLDDWRQVINWEQVGERYEGR